MRQSLETKVAKEFIKLALIGSLVLAVAIGLLNWLAKSTPPTTRAERVPLNVTAVCQQAIREHLRHPASASFAFFDHKAIVDGGQYYVWETVEAQNGFGAKIQSRAMCVFPPGRAELNPVVTLQ